MNKQLLNNKTILIPKENIIARMNKNVLIISKHLRYTIPIENMYNEKISKISLEKNEYFSDKDIEISADCKNIIIQITVSKEIKKETLFDLVIDIKDKEKLEKKYTSKNEFICDHTFKGIPVLHKTGEDNVVCLKCNTKFRYIIDIDYEEELTKDDIFNNILLNNHDNVEDKSDIMKAYNANDIKKLKEIYKYCKRTIKL